MSAYDAANLGLIFLLHMAGVIGIVGGALFIIGYLCEMVDPRVGGIAAIPTIWVGIYLLHTLVGSLMAVRQSYLGF